MYDLNVRLQFIILQQSRAVLEKKCPKNVEKIFEKCL